MRESSSCRHVIRATDLRLLHALEEDAEALDRDGLHVVALVVQLLQHRLADAPLLVCFGFGVGFMVWYGMCVRVRAGGESLVGVASFLTNDFGGRFP
jgi:hypothetical protein